MCGGDQLSCSAAVERPATEGAGVPSLWRTWCVVWPVPTTYVLSQKRKKLQSCERLSYEMWKQCPHAAHRAMHAWRVLAVQLPIKSHAEQEAPSLSVVNSHTPGMTEEANGPPCSAGRILLRR